MRQLFRRAVTIGAAVLLVCPVRCHAYSVLTHEAIIDVVWDTNIRPLLLKRFPRSTPDELLKAPATFTGQYTRQGLGGAAPQRVHLNLTRRGSTLAGAL